MGIIDKLIKKTRVYKDLKNEFDRDRKEIINEMNDRILNSINRITIPTPGDYMICPKFDQNGRLIFITVKVA